MRAISVVVPVYNGEKNIDSCYNFICNAGKRIEEIIFVDDGSQDGTFVKLQQLASNDNRIRIIHTENHGSYMARVTGIKAAMEDYIAFLDVDDGLVPGCLDMLAALLERYDADISFGGIVEVEDFASVNTPEVQRKTRIQTPEQMWKRIMKWKSQEFMLYIWHKLYKRELFDNLPELDGVCQGDDVILTCRAFLGAKKIVETIAPVYMYFVNPAGLTHKGFDKSDLDLIYVWDEVIKMTEGDKNISYLAQYNRWRTDFTLIMRLILSGDKDTDKKYSRELRDWRKSLKNHWKELLAPHAMPRNREVLIIALRFFFTPTKFMLRAVQKTKRTNIGILLHSGERI